MKMKKLISTLSVVVGLSVASMGYCVTPPSFELSSISNTSGEDVTFTYVLVGGQKIVEKVKNGDTYKRVKPALVEALVSKTTFLNATSKTCKLPDQSDGSEVVDSDTPFSQYCVGYSGKYHIPASLKILPGQ